jgi:hypothetical protein
MPDYSNEMLTINIAKTELKKAFFGGTADFTQNITKSNDSPDKQDIVLGRLKR